MPTTRVLRRISRAGTGITRDEGAFRRERRGGVGLFVQSPGDPGCCLMPVTACPGATRRSVIFHANFYFSDRSVFVTLLHRLKVREYYPGLT
jgi:hypothetical protein